MTITDHANHIMDIREMISAEALDVELCLVAFDNALVHYTQDTIDELKSILGSESTLTPKDEANILAFLEDFNAE